MTRRLDRGVPPAAGMDRRTFVGCVAGAAAVVAGTATRASAQDGVTWHRTPCRMCGVGCGLLVGVQRGRAVAVRGDPESPVSRGSACAKGYYSVQALYGRDRITRALVRRDGELVAAGMAEALDLVAGRIRDATARGGPNALAVYGSAQWTAGDALVAARLFRGAIGTTRVDTSARLHTASALAGLAGAFGHGATPGTWADLDRADTFVLWNVNLAETDPVLFSRILARRRENPAVRVVDLTSRTTRSSYAADRSLLLAPLSELAVAQAVSQELLARGLARRDFVDRYAAIWRAEPATGPEAQGLTSPAAGREVAWRDLEAFLAEHTPERAARESGMTAADIRWLATLYGDPTRRVVSLWGAAVNGQASGTAVNSALHNIHLLVGKVATPGNAAIPVTGQPGGAALLGDLLGHWGGPPDEAGRGRRASLLGTTASVLSSDAATPALSIFQSLERGELGVLWILGTNPMMSLPHLARYRDAARRSGAFIVVSDAYPTATTDVADVVLPAALWLERDGLHVNGERRIQYSPRLIRPPGDCLGDGAQMIAVARRLGLQGSVDWSEAGLTAATWALVRDAYAGELPDLGALREAPGITWPAVGSATEVGWRYGAGTDPHADAARGTFDFHGHADHRARIWLRPPVAPVEVPDAAYPFWLETGSVLEHWGTGTLTRRIPSLHRAAPKAYVEVHPADARSLGIRDGDMVRLTSRRGQVDVEARIGHRSQPARGRLFVPAFDEGTAVNLLAPESSCPVSGQPGSRAGAVRLVRLRSGAS